MNKTAIKNFAIWARVTLLEAVKQRSYEYEITENGENNPNADVIAGRPLTAQEKQQRRHLIQEIQAKTFRQTMEEAAYTWFNRFIALRYMEVNGYLPSRVRVFTNEMGEFKPEILKEAMTLDLPGLDREAILSLLDKQDNESLYKMLLIAQCNALSESLPQMFQQIANWTELLFPANLLKPDSVLGRMVSDIPEEDWQDQVQILGWAYQYYISERHEAVVDTIHGKIVKKEDIPAATQLFTTDWVVRYMVDNSLGRYWIERHPESTLGEKLEFFVRPKSGKMAYISEPVSPQELTFFDPCMGSGHILVYAFDVLMEIYKECGYSERDAAGEIVRNNLYGLDIDDRCSQLAYFAVMMKARSYDRRFLTRKIEPHVLSIQESNRFGHFTHAGFMPDGAQNAVGEYLLELFRDAKEIGSLKTAKAADYSAFLAYLARCGETAAVDMEFSLWNGEERPYMEHFAKQADILARKYAVVCTNPPYLNKLGGKLKEYITIAYKPYSSDLFSVFMYHNFLFCKDSGYSAFMTPNVWMFIKSYESLRNYILQEKRIASLVQMAKGAFFKEATVDICAFVLQNKTSSQSGLYFRLENIKGDMEVQKEAVVQAITNSNCGYFYETDQANFSKIPGSPVAYWVSDAVYNAYQNYPSLGSIAAPRKGNSTSDNNRFLRLWYEVDNNRMNLGQTRIHIPDTLLKRWYPYNKGGGYRKWYGYNEYLIDWYNDAEEIRAIKTAVIANYQYFMQPGLTWSTLTSGNFSIRKFGNGFIFDNGGCCIFELGHKTNYLLGLLNSSVFRYIFGQLNPTLNFQSGEVAKFPIISRNEEKVGTIVEDNVHISVSDYNSYETSWDFKRNPLV